MKMKKKGFTLVEILAVVIIIGILALLVTPLILETIESSNKKTYDEQVKRIHDIANMYATENKLEYVNGLATVTIGNLGAEGYIKLPVKDPITKGNFSEDYAIYFFESGMFICGEDFIDTRDDKVYKTVRIGNQCWMAENLAYINLTNDCTLKPWTTTAPYDACNTHIYNGRTEVLYQWWAAMNWNQINPVTQAELAGTQGLCPVGWHVPTDGEWQELEMFLGMSLADANLYGWTRGTNEGDMLKDNILSNGENTTGFSAIHSGVRYIDGNLTDVDSFGAWWTSTEFSATHSLRRLMSTAYSTIYRSDNTKSHGRSVRCVL